MTSPHNTFVEKKLEDWQKLRTRAISRMFDNVIGGIYPTTNFFKEIDAAFQSALHAAVEEGKMDAARRIGQAATSAGLTPAELTSGDNWKSEVAHLKAAAHDEGMEHGREEGRKKKHWVHKSTLHTLEEKIKSVKLKSSVKDVEIGFNAAIDSVLQEIRKLV